ncbi:ABC-type multidrug transport system ATPase subunit [Catenulispora sp. GAS73]|uniref:ATP-binding cassette domain-containing protein n=1 Tax=Catenulispora sp. GAS73 TaxID=3156269 RepID=UPI00351565EF
MIEAIELTSTRRSRGADGGPVQGVSFDVYPGQVTALLGAPGTGKSTVLRLMVELEPGGGRTLFGGRPYRALRPAVREVGLALNPDAVHPGRTVQAHLQLYAAGGGVPKPRIAEVLEVAGLSTQATVRCGRLDPGQRQRLAIAAALLGDPAALILDEPHALDTHGMSWFHALIRAYAAQGRTVLVAATDPDTLSGTADHVVVLRRDEQDGISRVIASRSAAEVFDERRATVVQVRSPQAARLAAALEAEGARLAPAGPGALQVRGLDRARIGEVAHVAGVCLHELCEIGHDDDVFGLRPVPRQKELLPGLNRTDTIWHSGVRLVADEIEEAEVIEAAAEASAEAAGGGGGGGAALAEVMAQASQGTSAGREAAAGVGAPAPVERQAGARGLVTRESAAGAQVVAEKQEPVAVREEAAAAGVGAQAERQAAGLQVVAEKQEPVAVREAAAGVGAQVLSERQAAGLQVVAEKQGPVAVREAGAGVGAQALAERQAAGLPVVAEKQEPVAVREAPAAGVGAQAERQAAGPQVAAEQQEPAAVREAAAGVGVQALAERQAERAHVHGSVAGPRESAAGKQVAAEQQAPVAAPESAASVGEWRSAEQVGGVAAVQPGQVAAGEAASGVRAAASADSAAVRADGVKSSAAGSWRTQGSVAGSRWSAVKGSQVRPSKAPTVVGGQGSASNLASAAEAKSVSAQSSQDPANSADQQGTVSEPQGAVAEDQPSVSAVTQSAVPSPEPRTPTKSPQTPRPTHRRAGAFGLRWGRGRSQRPVAPTSPEPVAAVVASAPSSAAATSAAPAHTPAPAPAQPQPAVPFTVASPSSQPDGGSDGMTPWRAAAARAAHQNQQQASVAEAAPAEQETSA